MFVICDGHTVNTKTMELSKLHGIYFSCFTKPYFEYHHRVDSAIESSLREITGSKNFALINLRLNFCETTIYDNKVFIENLVAVQLKTLYEIIKDFLKFCS